MVFTSLLPIYTIVNYKYIAVLHPLLDTDLHTLYARVIDIIR